MQPVKVLLLNVERTHKSQQPHFLRIVVLCFIFRFLSIPFFYRRPRRNCMMVFTKNVLEIVRVKVGGGGGNRTRGGCGSGGG